MMSSGSTPRCLWRGVAVLLVLVCAETAAVAQSSDSSAATPPAPQQAAQRAPQPLPPQELPLDPSAPLAPMPDLGVPWPDLPDVNAPASQQAKEENRQSRYEILLKGLEGLNEGAIRSRFDSVSALVKGKNKPANAAQIDLRARDDAGTLVEILRGRGYYDAEVTPKVQRLPDERLRVVLTATLGDQYHFSSVVLTGISQAPALLRDFPVKAGDVIDADKVTAAETAFRTALGKQGYAFAKAAPPDIVVDHANHTAQLVMAVDTAGEKKRFGHITVSGAKLFSARHVQTIARFHPGQRYDASLLDDLRRALIQTSLVSVVKITPVQAAQPDTVDIDVHLERAPPRTVAAQLGYGTGQGASITLSWTHRNLIKPEGAVTFSGILGTKEQAIGASLRQSNFHARDQVFTAQLTADRSNKESYRARTITAGVGIERQTNIIWQKKWTWSIGPQFLLSNERNIQLTTTDPPRRTFLIATLPMTLAYDGSDDLLNPTRGFRLAGLVSPEKSLLHNSASYARMQFDASAYLPINNAKVVLAGRVRIGSIVGAPLDEIAPSRRFYAGGGASVRGYGYQDIGPRDLNNHPVGGRGLAEFALEARIRFGNFGIVPFFDGGNIYTSSLPKFTGFQYGTGLGFRYYTSFGPIRVDLGTPLNRQKGDSRIAIAVSLGQAF